MIICPKCIKANCKELNNDHGMLSMICNDCGHNFVIDPTVDFSKIDSIAIKTTSFNKIIPLHPEDNPKLISDSFEKLANEYKNVNQTHLKCVVLVLDTENEAYNITRFISGGIKLSEGVALLDIAKQDLIEEII